MARRSVILVIVLLIGLTLSTCGGQKTPQAAVDALKSLRRMVSATEVGINYQEYGSRLIDLKGDVDEALAQLPDGELKTELTLAMEAYSDALVAWSKMLRFDSADTQFEPAKSLQKKYSIPQIQLYGTVMKITRDATLSTIWTEAAKHVDRASELVGQK